MPRVPCSTRLLDHAAELRAEDRLYLALAAALSSRAEAKEQARSLMNVSGEEMKQPRCRLLLALAEMAQAPGDRAVRERLERLIVDRMSGSSEEGPLFHLDFRLGCDSAGGIPGRIAGGAPFRRLPRGPRRPDV